MNLPSAPKLFIQYLHDDSRPQIDLDINYEKAWESVSEEFVQTVFMTGNLLDFLIIL